MGSLPLAWALGTEPEDREPGSQACITAYLGGVPDCGPWSWGRVWGLHILGALVGGGVQSWGICAQS